MSKQHNYPYPVMQVLLLKQSHKGWQCLCDVAFFPSQIKLSDCHSDKMATKDSYINAQFEVFPKLIKQLSTN